MLRIIVTIALLAVSGIACDKSDEFSDAPTVSAPEATADTPSGAEPARAPSKEDIQGKQMPADHPPIGSQGAPSVAPPAQNTGFASPAEYGKTGPLRWEAPETWTAAQPASSMRLAEYVVSGDEGVEPATMSIFYFGSAGGGGVEANVNRWVGQFSNPDGSPAAGNAKRKTETVNGMKVHRVDVAGTFNPGMAGSGPPKNEQRMLGAIVETPVGLYFFKLVGPQSTMDKAEEGFESFVKSFEPAS